VTRGQVIGEHWRLIEMDTGHWPMFSQPCTLAPILLGTAGKWP
jgi:hypothetical protein